MNPLEVLAKIAGLVGMIVLYKHYDRPASPWSEIGSAPYAVVRNTTDSAETVCAMAPEVDHAIRPVGTVAPRDSARLRLPYADTRVTLLYGRGACPSSWERKP